VTPLGEIRVEETGKRGRGLLYAAIAILVLAVLLTLLWRRKGAGSAEPTPPPAAPAQGAAPAAGPAAATPGPVLPAAASGAPVDINGLVGQELQKKEQELRKKYETQQKELEKQLAAAQKPGDQKPGAKTVPGPTAASSAAQATPAPSSAPPAAPSTAPEAAPAPVAQEPTPEPEAPKAQERPAAPQPAPAPEAPRVHTGDLVAGGPGVAPPELVSTPKPEYPPQARRLQVQGVVVVSVLVDENGHVQDARLVEPIAQKVGINEAAVKVARNAQYRPGVKDGVRVKMWTRLRIPFKL
jgi:TonB family protein